jgi:hypothetical protein
MLPMSDVIRLARHAHHYLAIFENGQAIALYHTKRLASTGQRIVLCARSRRIGPLHRWPDFGAGDPTFRRPMRGYFTDHSERGCVQC